MLVFNSPGVTIEFDEEKECLVQTWSGFVTSDVFRKAIDATVSIVEKEKVKTILSDTLNQKVVRPDDSKYAADAMPAIFKTGVKAMAFVMPENVLTQMSLKGFAQSTNDVNVNFFSNARDAHRWLDTQ